MACSRSLNNASIFAKNTGCTNRPFFCRFLRFEVLNQMGLKDKVRIDPSVWYAAHSSSMEGRGSDLRIWPTQWLMVASQSSISTFSEKFDYSTRMKTMVFLKGTRKKHWFELHSTGGIPSDCATMRPLYGIVCMHIYYMGDDVEESAWVTRIRNTSKSNRSNTKIDNYEKKKWAVRW